MIIGGQVFSVRPIPLFTPVVDAILDTASP
jgi:hypothetical protein